MFPTTGSLHRHNKPTEPKARILICSPRNVTQNIWNVQDFTKKRLGLDESTDILEGTFINIEFILCQDDENGEEGIMHALSGDVRKNSFTT